MNISRTHVAIFATFALLFVLVFAPVEISKNLLSMISTGAVIAAIAGGIYFVNQSMKKSEKSAKKIVNDLSNAVIRTEKAMRGTPSNALANDYFSNARRHLNDALAYLADGEFSDAERSAEAGKTALSVVLSTLGLTDEFVPAGEIAAATPEM
mgnify:CR=1 FL=1